MSNTKLVTARDLTKTSSPACSPQYQMTIPAGTRCKRLDQGIVVDDTSRVAGGNAHDLAHYYIWLTEDDVTEIASI
jgi:hypothetical protein